LEKGNHVTTRSSGSAVCVAYPGPDGTNSAAASEQLFPGGELIPLPSFSAVAEAAAAGAVDFGVLPIESSLVGPIAETHDLLYGSSLSITGETVIAIHHCLAGPAQVPLDEIRIVRSHPAALDQCRRLLAGLPLATAIATATTAGAAAQVAQDADPTEVAITSERAAELYGLVVLSDNVGDHPEAYTRFVSLGTYTRLDRSQESWRTAFSFVTDHRPGALHRAIEPFARHAVDLVQLVSRPIPHEAWQYRFDAVLAGHPLDPIISETLAELRLSTQQLAVFGSYPADA
jgi:prephenate dehydratase